VYVWREKPPLVIGGPDPLAVAHFTYLLMAAAFFFPSNRLAVAAALCARLAGIVASFPLVWDSNYWSALTDISALLHVLGLLPSIRRTMLAQMGMLYLAAGLLKLNTSFLDTRYSCAPIYIVQILDYHLLDFVPEAYHKSIVAAASQVIPAVTILGESAIGVFLLIAAALLGNDAAAAPAAARTAGAPTNGPSSRQAAGGSVASRLGELSALCGAALALSLHWGIALTPPPNNISEYGASCAVRLVWVAPAAAAVALTETWTRPAVGALYVLLAAAVWHAPCFAARPDVPGVVYALISAILGRAVYLSSIRTPPPTPATNGAAASRSKAKSSAAAQSVPTGSEKNSAAGASSNRGFAGIAMFLLTVFYSFGSPMLGILDISSPNMFSNLKQQGGSNHLFLPTSLLQRQFNLNAAARKAADATGSPDTSSSWIPDVYSGGIWRVELTNSTYLRARFPADLTLVLTPRTVSLLRAYGHSGSIWSSAASRVVGTFVAPFPAPLPKFMAYTLPAHEVRRILAEATAEAVATGEPFMLRVTMLEGDDAGEGSDEWLATGGGKEVEVHVDSSGQQVCTIITSNSGADVPAAAAAKPDLAVTPDDTDSAESTASEGEEEDLLSPSATTCDADTLAMLSPPLRRPWSSLLSEPSMATLSQVLLGVLATGLSSNSYPIVPGMTEHLHCYGS
jgi:hypothetical protein